MESRLPSLNALLAFEAAARLGSFTLAARELHVTQSAISHQVRTLEDELGLRLFDRLARALRPTRAGKRLAKASTEALDVIRCALAELQTGHRRTLVVSVLPSFAAHWLLPRLHPFHQAHPSVDLRLHSTPPPPALQTREGGLP